MANEEVKLGRDTRRNRHQNKTGNDRRGESAYNIKANMKMRRNRVRIHEVTHSLPLTNNSQVCSFS